jgi:hypothetical protein
VNPIRIAILAVVLYLIFLIWLFPYQSMVDHTIESFEASTGAQVNYHTRSAGPLGVDLDDVNVTMPSGIQMAFDSARLHPLGFQTLSAQFSQGNTDSELSWKSGLLTLHLDKLEFISGTSELGKVKATGNLTYDSSKQAGHGELLLQCPKFQAPLPIPDLPLDLGTTLDYANKGHGMEITADVHTVSGSEFSADGPIRVTPQPGQPVSPLSGTLNFKTPKKRGIMRLGGTWRKPHWDIVFNPS